MSANSRNYIESSNPIKASGFPFFFLILVLLTNRYLSFSNPELLPPDCFSYIQIAKAFPALPSVDLRLPFHHAQRFILPYLVGGFSKLTGISIESSFRGAVLVAIAGMISLLSATLQKLPQVSSVQKKWIFALLILNPYSFRIYLAAPALLNDLFFQVGLTALLLGLVGESAWIAVAGITLSAVSRQTALLLLPATLLWMVFLWPKEVKGRLIGAVGSVLIAVSLYYFTSQVGTRIGGNNINIEHVTGLLRWLNAGPSLKIGLEFVARGVLGFAFFLCVFILTSRSFFNLSKWSNLCRKQTLFLLLFAALIVAQPIAGGPLLTGRDITRLSLLGFSPLLIALAIAFSYSDLKEKVWEGTLPLLVGTAVAGSFHHMYSFLGSGNGSDRTEQFALIHLGCAALFVLSNLQLWQREN
jgi:hypothetical protein